METEKETETEIWENEVTKDESDSSSDPITQRWHQYRKRDQQIGLVR